MIGSLIKTLNAVGQTSESVPFYDRRLTLAVSGSAMPSRINAHGGFRNARHQKFGHVDRLLSCQTWQENNSRTIAKLQHCGANVRESGRRRKPMIQKAIEIFKAQLPEARGKFRPVVSERNANEVEFYSEDGLYCVGNVRSGKVKI